MPTQNTFSRSLFESGSRPQRDAKQVGTGQLRIGHPNKTVPRSRVSNVSHLRRRNGLQDLSGSGAGVGEPFGTASFGLPVPHSRHQRLRLPGRFHFKLLFQVSLVDMDNSGLSGAFVDLGRDTKM